MIKGLVFFLSFLFLCAELQAAGQHKKCMDYKLDNATNLESQRIPKDDSVKILLPRLSQKNGYIIALRFRAVAFNKAFGGANFNGSFSLNGHELGRFTSDGKERLIGRRAELHLNGRSLKYPLYSGSALFLVYAPSVEAADLAAEDNQGATFLYDISDCARGVDGNALEIFNLWKHTSKYKGHGDLIVENIEIGWIKKSDLPVPPSRVPSRKVLQDKLSFQDVTLSGSMSGGFSVSSGAMPELMVETVINMKHDARSGLIASDKTSRKAKVSTVQEGPNGYRTTAHWKGFSLVRRIQIENGIISWTEEWTNTSTRIKGLPFRHRFFLRKGESQFYISGTRDVDHIACTAQNPTLFIGDPGHPEGNGYGVTVESDWGRLLTGMRWGQGVGEIFTQHLALAPGKSVVLDFTITLVSDKGGYWSFINSVRKRWEVKGTAEIPFYWSWTRRPDLVTEENFQKAFGHLGPLAAKALPPSQHGHPWLGFAFDIATLYDNKYPKLPASATPIAGKTSDLDVRKWLEHKHREFYWEKLADYVETMHEAVPEVKIIVGMEPGTTTTYMPHWQRWPYAESFSLKPDKTPYRSANYDSAYLRDWEHKDWGMTYAVPESGSRYLKKTLLDIDRAFEEIKVDGLYVDESAWVSLHSRGYTRYNYRYWDGYSADLDERGNVIQLKSDNGYAAREALSDWIQIVKKKGGYFIANSPPTLSGINKHNTNHFLEGGNGSASWPSAHLSSVPLVLGNFGKHKTLKDYFDKVKALLRYGCIFSPYHGNKVYKGPDNFAHKLYPITIKSLGSGTVVGEERLITIHSGSYKWHDKDIKVQLYIYNENGILQNPEALPKMNVKASVEIKLEVPTGGLVIAEVMK